MLKLIEQFRDNSNINNVTTYKNLVRVFGEQFVDNDGKAELVKHPDGTVLLNPSDPDAEIVHKEVGYQVQISETCSENNDVQFITAAIPQGESRSDMESLPEVEEKLEHIPPMRRLRVRGRKAVYHSIYAILTMHNLCMRPVMGKIRSKRLLHEPFFHYFREKSFYDCKKIIFCIFPSGETVFLCIFRHQETIFLCRRTTFGHRAFSINSC